MKKIRKPSFLAIIPARGNSKRIKDKNIRIFNGKPLIYWTIVAALKSKFIDEVYVTSDDKRILEISNQYAANTITRPKKLSGPVIHGDIAMKHAYLKINKKFDYIIMLQPTCPLRTSKNIDEAIKIILNKNYDSLLSVNLDTSFIWKKEKNFYKSINYNFRQRPRKQDVKFYKENGAIYITKTKILLKNNNRLGGKIGIYNMKYEVSVDIDTLSDFKIAEYYFKNK
jgi:CMP-N,N'-diacetyllegionaminic acid synthase